MSYKIIYSVWKKNIVEAKEFVRERYKIFERDLKSVTKSEKEMTF